MRKIRRKEKKNEQFSTKLLMVPTNLASSRFQIDKTANRQAISFPCT